MEIKDQNDFGLLNTSSESYKTMDKFLYNPKNKTKKQQQKSFLRWILYSTINCECQEISKKLIFQAVVGWWCLENLLYPKDA